MDIKKELVICYGCLSSDRNLAPLGILSDIFYTLMTQTFVNDNVLLCWECRSIMMKIWKFRQRIHQAQILLQTSEVLLNDSVSSLSTLQSKVINNNCEIVYEYYEDIDGKVKLEIDEEFNDVNSDLDRHDDMFNVEEIIIESKEVIVEDVVIKEEKQHNKIDSSLEFNINDKVYDELIQNESKTENIIKQLKPLKKNQIEIASENKKSLLEGRTFNEEFNGSKVEIINKTIKKNNEKLSTKSKRKFKEEKQCRYKKRELITKNSLNLKRFYVTCDVNDKVLEEILDRRMTIKYPGKSRIMCVICNMVFYKEIDHRRHNTLKHLPEKGPYKCCECIFVKTKTVSELHEHWRTHKVYKCCLCPNVSVTERQITRHLQQTHQHTYKCLECGNEFYAYRDIFRHYNDAHNVRICDHCGKTFKRKKVLEEHMIWQHLPSKCDICGHVCKTGHGLSAHKRVCRPDKHFDVIAAELSYCVECNKQYDTIEKYRNHLRSSVSHNPPVPVRVPCPDCGKTFSRKLYMNNHYKLVHIKKSKHYCEICNKYFISAFSLRTHRNRVHEKKYPPKDKICDICGRGFRANRVLIQHKRTHTGEKPYQCSYCPSAFSQITAKKTHERTQHKVI